MINALLFILSAALGFSFTSPLTEPPQTSFGAALPAATAVFETSLAAPITSSATSLTLTANAVRGGGSISGYSCLTIDEGSAQHEVVCGTVSGTSVTGLSRGISFATGTTTVSANQFAHRRGANVKITDFPILQILKAQAAGQDTYPNILQYDNATPDCASNNEICDYGFITGLAFSGAGVVNASTIAKGVVEIATQVETASSTSAGSTGALLAIPASAATSTYNANTASTRVVVTQNSGQIDGGFLVNAGPVGSITAYASSTPPTGWLAADGSAVSRTTYANLFAVIGTTYGAGNGATTFNLPDIRGRNIVMASSTQTTASGLNRSTYGATGTTTTHTLTIEELAPHTHTMSVSEATGPNQGSGSSVSTSDGTTGSTGSGTPFNILDPYIVMNYIIKY